MDSIVGSRFKLFALKPNIGWWEYFERTRRLSTWRWEIGETLVSGRLEWFWGLKPTFSFRSKSSSKSSSISRKGSSPHSDVGSSTISFKPYLFK